MIYHHFPTFVRKPWKRLHPFQMPECLGGVWCVGQIDFTALSSVAGYETRQCWKRTLVDNNGSIFMCMNNIFMQKRPLVIFETANKDSDAHLEEAVSPC